MIYSKKMISMMLALLASSTLLAQPNFHADNVPAQGYVMSNAFLGGDIPPLTNGPDQTWDLSALEVIRDYVSEFLDPMTTAWGGDHPEANLACHFCPSPFENQSPDWGTDYFNSDANGLYLTGSHRDNYPYSNYVNETYSDPLKIISFPTTYGTEWSDDATVLLSTDYAPDAIQPRSSGIQTADGYGTLVLPGGTLNNVLKIHSESTSSYEVAGVLHESVYASDDFIRPGIKYFVARRYYQLEYEDGVLVNSLYLNPSVLNDLTVGLEDLTTQRIGIEITPSVGDGAFAVAYGASGRVNMKLFDALGRSLWQMDKGQLTPGIHRDTIDLSSLPNGQYYLQIITADGQMGNRKLTVAH